MGAAANDGDPRVRDSLASSQYYPDGGRGSETGSSVYALRDMSPTVGSVDGLRPGVARQSSFGRYTDDPHGDAMGGATYMPEKRAAYVPRKRGGKRLWIIVGGVAAAIILIAIAVPVAITASKKKPHSNLAADAQSSSGASNDGKGDGGGKGSNPSKPTVALITGGDGSTVTMDDGTTFTYSNQFNGIWYQDPANPYFSAAKPNSWTPALNETFTYGVDRIFGVNLGGWLNTEPFISPALYQKYFPNAVDEWTLSEQMRADTAGGGINQLEDHYKTFITERDFAEIAGAGLNYVRIPIPYWAIEVRGNEPFLAKTCWTYFLKAVEWARKYGIRINIDLHAIPGSQNSWNHSG
jgi:glucan 1,3-beta-glucosidase